MKTSTWDKLVAALCGILGIWLGAAILCVPIWWLWNKLAPIYFYWLPAVYLKLPFWHAVGLSILILMLKRLFRRDD
jgi:hypothetical protein